MITVFGEGRGFPAAWLREEMELRDVDLRAGAEHDAEFLEMHPAGFIPGRSDHLAAKRARQIGARSS